jgi:alpha-L-fucosidase
VPADMRALAQRFNPEQFDADALCDLAVAGGMRYVNLTTMHHEGFRLYDTELSDFNSMAVCGRDLVEEFVTAARKRGLRIALYHSLNNWYDQPDACDALENENAYEAFLAATFSRLRELVTRFNPIDILWYDGWWPFTAERWRAEAMNAMVRKIQPHILFNGRNGLAGDFGTPEGHMSAPDPWRPWEACMTLNDHWGYHCGDDNWPGSELVIAGLNTDVESVWLWTPEGRMPCAFCQVGEKVTVTGLPACPPDSLCPVLQLECRTAPEMRLEGGMRIPCAPHPPYDPCASDIQQ